ncbi:Protein of unknown function [Bacillus cereus]|jgi:hypothetical protein
MGY